ncbi:MAG: hypothetical protein AAF694_18625 [Bacteroidota bacterium]
MDLIFIVELLVVGLAVAAQFYIFFSNNRAIKQFAQTYPEKPWLATKSVPISSLDQDLLTAEPETMEFIEEQARFHPYFKEIVQTTNSYLEKNKGEANFDILKEMSEIKLESQEDAIEGNINLPLYVGLLCTFTGVIIGLIKIAFDGVSDESIGSFIGGVLIGMIGSAMGLLLTVRSNYIFKNARKTRDKREYDYFTFLRTYILPALPKTQNQTLSSLRESLSAFNQGFVQYQSHMNSSLEETLKLFRDLKGVFNQIRNIEQGLNGMGNFLQVNDGLIEKQISYIESYAQKAEDLSSNLGRHFSQVDQKLNQIVDDNLRAIDQSAQSAYMKMDQYLSSLQHGDTRAFADSLNQDLNGIRREVANIQQRSLEINERLLGSVSQGQQAYQVMMNEMKSLNAKLESQANGGVFLESGLFKFFVAAGIIACIVGIASGATYLINLISL